jgi:four helix bundle protein
MPTFTGLRVWKEAYELSLQVYRQTADFPPDERYGLTSQMRRAAVSVGANVAEGQKRRTRKDFRSFVTVAEGSLAELQHYLLLGHDLGYLSQASFEALCEQAATVERMLVGLSRTLGDDDKR